jgi:iron complex transport system substrate-binding protein
MRKPLFVLLLLFPLLVVGQQLDAEHYRYRDAAGRDLVLPRHPDKVYATNQIGIILLYSLAPERLAGWIFPLQEAEKPYLQPQYYDLPVLGGWSGRSSSANVEEIARVHPDIIYSIGPIDGVQLAQAETLQAQTGIPVVMLTSPLTGMDRTYREVGAMLGVTQQADKLARYCQQTISEVQDALAKLPDEKRVRVYYAEGGSGLETDPAGSFHTEVLDLVKGINVAQVTSSGVGFGRSEVSIEQVLNWDPEVILVGYDKQTQDGFFKQIDSLPQWQPIQAVRQRQIYQIPFYPYDWFDRPPSVNRLIGVKWLAHLLYPDYLPLDMAAETRRFYQLFYHMTLSETQLRTLLMPASRGDHYE